MKKTIAAFRKKFQEQYPHISYTMTDEQIFNKLFEYRDISLERMMDRFADYLLSQNLVDEVQE